MFSARALYMWFASRMASKSVLFNLKQDRWLINFYVEKCCACSLIITLKIASLEVVMEHILFKQQDRSTQLSFFAVWIVYLHGGKWWLFLVTSAAENHDIVVGWMLWSWLLTWHMIVIWELESNSYFLVLDGFHRLLICWLSSAICRIGSCC